MATKVRNASAADIGERLRESEQWYRAIIEGARDYAIFTLALDGRVESWSPGAETVFGWAEAEILGQPFAITFTPEDRARDVPALELAIALERGVAPDVRWHLHKDGTRVFIDGTTRLLRRVDGEPSGFLKIGQDVTRRREMEQAVRELNESLEQRVAQRTAERDMLRQKLTAAEEEERRRLARELHDEVGQHLTALSLGLQALADVAATGSEVDRRVAQLHMLVNTLGRDLHAISIRLRPKALDDFGLVAALDAAAALWADHSGIKVDVHANVGDDRLPTSVESAVYRIAQEALTNVARHSRARHASVVVERRPTEVTLVVEDDGRGFDNSAEEPSSGLGLIGIRERAELLGGTLEVETRPGGGTAIYVRIPMAALLGGGRF